MTNVEKIIRRPVTVTVGVILVLLFGLLALFKIPVQLTPEVVKPEITVETFWRGASPSEIEREIIDREEEQLKTTPGLVEMTSESQDSRGRIVLTFQTGTDLNAALLQVSNRLDQVREFPQDAERPVIRTVNTSSSAIAWIILKTTPDNPIDVYLYRDFAEDFIKPRLERVPGVGLSNVYGGSDREMQVLVDPNTMASLNVTIIELLNVLDRQNTNVSAGDFSEGKRRYIVRTIGEYSSPEDIENVVVKTVGGKRIFIRDFAHVQLGYKKAFRTVRQTGEPAIAVNAIRESGANTLKVMVGIKEAIKELNEGLLKDNGLYLTQVYDETDYIVGAIDLVKQNLVVGSLLAIAVLVIFLRSASSTIIVATTIPISVIGTLFILLLLGRNLNVVSLAGMTFAVGMVVDVAIVVLENIYRHRQMGKSRQMAVLHGMDEVWGAVVASTMTTMAVFLPILFIEEEIGQLFRDIAIAISCAVGLSLIVAGTVIPTFASRILGDVKPNVSEKRTQSFHGLFGLVSLAGRFADGISNIVYRICGSYSLRLGVIVGFTLVSVGLTWKLMLPPDYLPEGNRNLVIGFLLPPPGYNLNEIREIGEGIERDLRSYWEKDPANPKATDPEGPAINNFFYVASGRQFFMGVRTVNPERIKEIIPIVQQSLRKIPGMIAIVNQGSIFARGLGSGKSVDLEFSGPDLNKLVALAGQTFSQIKGLMPQAQIRPIPSLDLGNPELQIIPDTVLMSDLNMSTRDLGITVDVLLDGRKATDYQMEGKKIDLTVRGLGSENWQTQDIEHLPIRTPNGRYITLGSLADVVVTNGPEQINHVERNRTVAISVVPPVEMPLQEAMDLIEEKIVAPLKESGSIAPPYTTRLSGTADELEVTKDALKWNLILAIFITYLLIAALFESFIYSLVIMFSVPLAAGGGFLGLWLVSTFKVHQNLDVLTMLGFIILIGIVVNNAILIVHQALNYIRREGEAPREAVRHSVKVRVRPIFMSTLTSVFGMLPLVLFTGPGSELYRGIGSVVVGGLVLSTVFTLFLVPALFSLLIDLKGLLTRNPDPAIKKTT